MSNSLRPHESQHEKTIFFLFKLLTFPHKLCFPIYRNTGRRWRNSTRLQWDAGCHCRHGSSAAYGLFTGTWDHISCQEIHHLQHPVDVKCPPKLQHPFSHLSNSNKYRAGKRAQTWRERDSRKSIFTLPFPEPLVGVWGASIIHPLSLALLDSALDSGITSNIPGSSLTR